MEHIRTFLGCQKRDGIIKNRRSTIAIKLAGWYVFTFSIHVSDQHRARRINGLIWKAETIINAVG
ncbi:hypothetical protein ASD02_16750 [Ensifer sp. Root1252]|nr:hypothetical protein ASD02_16750 [Ensifer sp. Root1252]KQW55628.1 hypothetical protein ASD03_18905 [Ensifer sp. Root127]KQY76970.1 hypothetical protein ASD52_23525 [Ensifer sp. Root142]KRC57201.1 hypothetical protein ASE32_20065 [Ensifer sp. Root231]KRC87696.1 hypothetical protein ASE47_14220 [Ensifer sp. Root258]